jgi:putative flippase GtrA
MSSGSSAYLLNARFVFHKPLNWKTAFQFPLVYVVQYLAGVALLSFWVEVLQVGDLIAPLLVIACTVPVTFVLSRFIIKGHGTHTAEPSA